MGSWTWRNWAASAAENTHRGGHKYTLSLSFFLPLNIYLFIYLSIFSLGWAVRRQPSSGTRATENAHGWGLIYTRSLSLSLARTQHTDIPYHIYHLYLSVLTRLRQNASPVLLSAGRTRTRRLSLSLLLSLSHNTHTLTTLNISYITCTHTYLSVLACLRQKASALPPSSPRCTQCT